MSASKTESKIAQILFKLNEIKSKPKIVLFDRLDSITLIPNILSQLSTNLNSFAENFWVIFDSTLSW